MTQSEAKGFVKDLAAAVGVTIMCPLYKMNRLDVLAAVATDFLNFERFVQIAAAQPKATMPHGWKGWVPVADESAPPEPKEWQRPSTRQAPRDRH